MFEIGIDRLFIMFNFEIFLDSILVKRFYYFSSVKCSLVALDGEHVSNIRIDNDAWHVSISLLTG